MEGFLERWNKFGTKKWVPYFLLIVIGICISVVASKNEIWDGGADNYWHYYFSKYAFQFPKYFLHHWGKPFFILLTCAFSQFGFYAVNVFNIICGLLSALIAFNWCRKLGLRYSLAVIIVIIFAPVYLSVIQTALTEPLFSLLVIYSAYLLYFEKYTLGCLVISTLPFSRSEGMFILMIFATYLVIVRRFKYLPLLTVTFVFYAILGLFAGKNFMWYFTENPYGYESPYGNGSYSQFIERYDFTFGAPYIIAFGLGFIFILRNIIVNKEYIFWKTAGDNLKLFCLSFLPTLAFFLFHVYAWGAGKFGSAGLERVMASVIPIGAVTCMIGLNGIYKINFKIIRTVLLVVFLYFTVGAPFIRYSYPTKAYGPENVARIAAEWFVPLREPGSYFFYTHPAIVFFADYNPFESHNSECMKYILNKDCSAPGISGKFYYVWDSYFTSVACRITLEELEKCPNLKKMKEFSDGDFKMVFFETK